MRNSDKKDRLRGLLGAVLFHGIFLTVFLLFGFRSPLPHPHNEGIEIRLGDLDGMGKIDLSPPPAYIHSTPSDVRKTAEEMLIQNTEKTFNVNKALIDLKKVKTDKVKTVVKDEKEIGPVVNDNLIYRPGDKNGHNQGHSNKQGYQGSPDGNPNSNNPEGTNSNDISYALNGRSIKYLPKPEYNSPEQGKVVVTITVDREGKVIKAFPGAQGTTTTDTRLKKLATDAALKATFKTSPKAPEEQVGTITYKFIKLN